MQRTPYDPYSGQNYSAEPEELQNEETFFPPVMEPDPSDPYEGDFKGDFSDPVPEDAPSGEEEETGQEVYSTPVYVNPHSDGSGFLKVIFALLILIVLAIFLPSRLFLLKSIHVDGCEERSPEQIAAMSGLVRGRNMFSIHEEEIISALGKDYTLIYRGMKKDYANRTIYLFIEERKVIAAYRRLGMAYLLDADGMVMQEREMDDIPENLPIILGFSVSGVNVGQMLTVSSSSQMDAYRAVLNEIQESDGIREVNLKDPDDIYLETEYGISVRLGSAEYMHAKFIAYRTDVAYLRQFNTPGVLDLSIPEDAKFRPES